MLDLVLEIRFLAGFTGPSPQTTLVVLVAFKVVEESEFVTDSSYFHSLMLESFRWMRVAYKFGDKKNQFPPIKYKFKAIWVLIESNSVDAIGFVNFIAIFVQENG